MFCLFCFIFLLFFNFIIFIITLWKMKVLFLEWDFLSLKFNFYFNSLYFFLVLLLVSFMIFLFGCFYMYGANRLVYFFIVLFSFVMSMGGLIMFSNSIILTLIFWDYLGISSFFLVLFYNNLTSLSGAMSTVFTNRIGDFCIFLFFNGLVLCSMSHLNFQFFSSLVAFMLFICSFVKGGQYPFGSWLPKAMAAPTPVSCLVHSSTLVTAGIMLMDAYSYILMNFYPLLMMVFGGFFTMVFAGICALFEPDAKKNVALSTKPQKGFGFLSMGWGLHYLSFLHMVGHSFFKSLLFVQVGYLIYINSGQQDYRGYNNYYLVSPIFVFLQIIISILCLCGLLFSGGFLTKEFIMSRFYYDSFNFFVVLFYFLGIFFTFCYCQRLINIFWGLNFSSCFCGYTSNFYYYSSLFLGSFSIFFMFWLVFNLFFFEYSLHYFEGLVIYLYIFFYIGFLIFFLKWFIFEFKNKFFMDNYAMFIYKLIPEVKFLECFLPNFNTFFFGSFRVFPFMFLNLMRGIFSSSLIFLSLFIFIFLFF
uniref:NADH:ubiquinone reductase (H(+)-translocating) n=1 Tax=Heliconema longissimum TaxID=657295 RepID=G4V236_9BILA|nr:NADH dehydrogenase subunit 5 [Heliconema longissimum]ACV96723.1 NADH dehydrogenase subunit 5 [Heliconema longissimum]